jgi:LmbE family N-acetylglucosaminyl deacetylase
MQILPVPKRLLVVAAHPDDAEAGCGGTVAKLVKAGAEAHILILTDGAAGMNPTGSAADLIRIREQEAQAAGAKLGAVSVTTLRQPDGELQYNSVIRGQIVRRIRELQPDMVFTHESLPYSRFDGEGVNHADHRTCGLLVMDAVYPYSRSPALHPEVTLPPHTVRELLIFGSLKPNHYEDVGEFVDIKLAALAEHRSQFGDHMPDWFRNCLRIAGSECGVEYAESFYRISFQL